MKRKHLESARPLSALGRSLDEIEGAVENWRQQVLPDIEADLLSPGQFTRQAKNGELTCNGTSPVFIKTPWQVPVSVAEIPISWATDELLRPDEPIE